MNRRGVRIFCLLMLIATAISGVLRGQQTDARGIVQKVYEQGVFQSLDMRASLTIYDRQGQSEKKEFRYRRLNTNQGSKTRIDMTAPAEEKGVVLLEIQQPGVAASQYVYTPAIDRVRSLGTQDRTVRFLGSDFILDDFADRNPRDYMYRLLGETEKIDGQETYKIESRPVDRGSSPYAYVYLWIAKKAPVIVFAQMYTASGTMVRALHAMDLRHEAGVWGMRRTEVSTAADHTRSILTLQNIKLNQHVDDAAFSPQGLGSNGPPGKM